MLVFLPGDHNLNRTISVGTLSSTQAAHQPHSDLSLTLLGSPSSLPEVTSRIICTWPAGFHFSGITELNITALAFISCGNNDSAAINILSVSNCHISNCTFSNNANRQTGSSSNTFGGALFANNSILTQIAGNSFYNNFANFGAALFIDTNNTIALLENTFLNNSADYGSTLYANTNNALTLSGNEFLSNFADIGGVIHAQSDNTLTLLENVLQNNFAQIGGAVEVQLNNTLTLSGNTFENNSAAYGGALIANTNNTLTLSENTFQNNSGLKGGALNAYINNTLTLSENTFAANSANYGGALYAHTDNSLTLLRNTFLSNFAGLGGAVYAHIDNALTVLETVFQNNFAQNGGALELQLNNTLNLSRGTFKNNFAAYGGSLFANASNTLALSGNIFLSNSADNGGALNADANNSLTLSENTFQDNSANFFGGALMAYTDNALTLLENTFQNNSATDSGGAVLASANNVLIISANTFQRNSANYAGAVYAHAINALTLHDNTFLNNSGNYRGALFAYISNTLTLSENTFQNNYADFGGGICADTKNTLTLSNNTFQNNSAESGGGALIAVTGNIISLSENIFMNNSADYGGAVYANTITVSDDVIQNDTADDHEDPLNYANEGNTFIFSENIFQSNFANRGGAIFVDINNDLIIVVNAFQRNSALYEGGAVAALANNTLVFSNNTFQYNYAGIGNADVLAIDNTFSNLENRVQNNSDSYGGAVATLTNNTLILSGNIFHKNFADSGGALHVDNTTLVLSGNIFQGNSAFFGGALLTNKGNTVSISGNKFLINLAKIGGALAAYRSNNITLEGNTLENNYVNFSGGAIFVNINNTVVLSENKFLANTALHYGGAFYANFNSTLTFSQNRFQDNIGSYGGALYAAINNTITLVANTFQINSANYGGTLHVYSSNDLHLVNNTLRNNSANYEGGALYVSQSRVHSTDNIFTNNTAQSGGGAVFCSNNGTLVLYGSHRILNNTSQYGGGIAALDCQIILDGELLFQSNKANFGGGVYADQSWFSGVANFSNNSANVDGGGIYASRTKFHFKQCTFAGNSAQNGGGLLLTEGSKLYLLSNTIIDFIDNSALQKGGAIKVEKNNPLSYCVEVSCGVSTGSDCFFQIETARQYDINTIDKLNISGITELHGVMVYFSNNTAFEAGADLYGGSVSNCSLNLINLQPDINVLSDLLIGAYRCPNSGEVFDYITSFNEQSQLDISSDPLYICSCEGGEPDCSAASITRSVYPGGAIGVAIIAYGERNGTTPAVIHNITPRGDITFSEPENTQSINNTCTPLSYTVQTRAIGTAQDITLNADGPCPPKERTISRPSFPTNLIKVHVFILQCPPGFELSQLQPACHCAQRLEKFSNICRIEDGKIERATEFWVGYKQDNTSDGLILHPHCPFDYCTSNELYIAVDDSDEQCSNNRTGLLCGKCDKTFSLVLGTNRCLQCSNNYLWLIVAFAFAGVALVLLLLVLRLTVAVGTINGLIFYANIITMNSATFYSPHTNVLTVFIAWLNLDLGIETCFYDGLDAYTKAWLQFVFPFYVWALVGIIILISHYSAKVATILGTNPIAVLATLFLLSYTKVLRAVIAALSYTLLQYPNNSNVAVWLYDGNIGYLSSKHIPLFIGALVCLIVLFLPYTLFLIFSQWLRSKSGQYRIFSWVNHYRVIPFLEAYHAPYTDKHRYWTGLMLLVRCALFLLFALNAFGDPSVNLLAIGSITAILPTVYALFANRIYKNWYLNTLELSFIVNLGILAVATLYIRSAGGNQNAVTITSISVAFATFVGIIIYHSVQQIKHSPQLWRKLFPRDDTYELVPQTNSNPEGVHPPSPPDPSDGTATVVHIDLRDLLENARNELREPCIEMDN